jgi:hypothetical protein
MPERSKRLRILAGPMAVAKVQSLKKSGVVIIVAILSMLMKFR